MRRVALLGAKVCMIVAVIRGCEAWDIASIIFPAIVVTTVLMGVLALAHRFLHLGNYHFMHPSLRFSMRCDLIINRKVVIVNATGGSATTVSFASMVVEFAEGNNSSTSIIMQ